MITLTEFPHELLLLALSNLHLSGLRALRITSKFWDAFVSQYSDVLFKNAAITHGFITSQQAEVDVQLQDCAKWNAIMELGDLSGWEDLCKRYCQLDHSWRGDWVQGRGDRPKQRAFSSTTYRVHRLKIVPDDQLAIVTIRRPPIGMPAAHPEHAHLIVSDLRTDRVLWSLPSTHVRMYAHCEYDAGFMVFDRGSAVLEVWRRATDVQSSPLPDVKGVSQADAHMYETATAAFSDPDIANPLRGQFVPHALIAVPVGRLAYHLVGTTLVIASEWHSVAFLYDVASGELLEKLELVGKEDGMWSDLLYVELDPVRRRVFISTDNGVLVYANETLQVDSAPDEVRTKIVAHVCNDFNAYGCVSFAVPDMRPGWTSSNSPPFQALAWKGVPGGLPHNPSSYIHAAHVSPDGRDLVMINENDIIIAREFMSGNPEKVTAVSLPRVRLRTVETEYLAFDGTRVAVASSDGIFVLDTLVQSVVWMRPHKNQTHRFSCIQLTREAVWATWGDGILDAAPSSLLCVDFSRPQREIARKSSWDMSLHDWPPLGS